MAGFPWHAGEVGWQTSNLATSCGPFRPVQPIALYGTSPALLEDAVTRIAKAVGRA